MEKFFNFILRNKTLGRYANKIEFIYDSGRSSLHSRDVVRQC